jgi:hypothetical protein
MDLGERFQHSLEKRILDTEFKSFSNYMGILGGTTGIFIALYQKYTNYSISRIFNYQHNSFL